MEAQILTTGISIAISSVVALLLNSAVFLIHAVYALQMKYVPIKILLPKGPKMSQLTGQGTIVAVQ